MEFPFATLDVFTTKRLEGNPLAIVRVPASLRDRLTQPLKQKIAQEFNLSETVFLHDDTSKAGASAREVDIFTVERELPFAGHPTIGTAVFVQHHLGISGSVQKLITKAGAIPIAPSDSDGSAMVADIPHNTRLHGRTLRDVFGADESAITANLHPNPEIRAAELDAPAFSIVAGMAFVLVKLASLELLGEVSAGKRLDFDALPAPLLDEGWRESFVSRYYYVDVDALDDNDATQQQEKGEKGEGVRHLRTRMVELGFEDPATGSAASALSAYLTRRERKGTRFEITQGVEMGRKSVISVETSTKIEETDTGNKVKLDKVYLGGSAVVVLQGTLRVDDVDV
ncbi:hypothetical protein F4777DRAFT_243975 [Nemania sp. FL0916]|nr:hypothetical protein F4777DRAFT_243975 [Nemania sp. FL0916]